MAVPGCPDPARSTESMASTRMRSTVRWSTGVQSKLAFDEFITALAHRSSPSMGGPAAAVAAGFHYRFDPIGERIRLPHPMYVISGGGPVRSLAMNNPELWADPRAVIEGRPPGRPGTGIVIGVVVGLGCALLALGVDLLESLGSSRHSVAPFLIAL